MRRKKRKRFRKKKFKINQRFVWGGLAVFLTLAILSGAGYLIYTSPVFKIKYPDIKSNVTLSKRINDKIVGDFLFSLNSKEISSKLLTEHPEYKKVRILKRPPSTLVIEVEKRIPFAQIKGKARYLIDREAVIINSGSSNSWPDFITIEIDGYNNQLVKGYKIKDQRLEYAFRLIEALKAQEFSDTFKLELINSTSSQAVYLIASQKSSLKSGKSYTNSLKIIFGKGNYKQKIDVLKELINQELNDKLSLVRYIDLRHKKAYVGFKR
jgi:cell division septal protein FtsQ